mmetsp:Transcript_16889/g.38635  ORF Transcript_16889/g.38635 Transcript_16889/m.38635 type:complete len:214 (+) Transcript_16889:1258-1899(+)
MEPEMSSTKQWAPGVGATAASRVCGGVTVARVKRSPSSAVAVDKQVNLRLMALAGCGTRAASSTSLATAAAASCRSNSSFRSCSSHCFHRPIMSEGSLTTAGGRAAFASSCATTLPKSPAGFTSVISRQHIWPLETRFTRMRAPSCFCTIASVSTPLTSTKHASPTATPTCMVCMMRALRTDFVGKRGFPRSRLARDMAGSDRCQHDEDAVTR